MLVLVHRSHRICDRRRRRDRDQVRYRLFLQQRSYVVKVHALLPLLDGIHVMVLARCRQRWHRCVDDWIGHGDAHCKSSGDALSSFSPLRRDAQEHAGTSESGRDRVTGRLDLRTHRRLLRPGRTAFTVGSARASWQRQVARRGHAPDPGIAGGGNAAASAVHGIGGLSHGYPWFGAVTPSRPARPAWARAPQSSARASPSARARPAASTLIRLSSTNRMRSRSKPSAVDDVLEVVGVGLQLADLVRREIGVEAVGQRPLAREPRPVQLVGVRHAGQAVARREVGQQLGHARVQRAWPVLERREERGRRRPAARTRARSRRRTPRPWPRPFRSGEPRASAASAATARRSCRCPGTTRASARRRRARSARRRGRTGSRRTARRHGAISAARAKGRCGTNTTDSTLPISTIDATLPGSCLNCSATMKLSTAGGRQPNRISRPCCAWSRPSTGASSAAIAMPVSGQTSPPTTPSRAVVPADS